jgi:site-specific recombinase XerD
MNKKEIFNRNLIESIPQIKNWLGMYSRNSKDTSRRIEKEICVFFNALEIKTLQDVENFKVENISKLYDISSQLGWSNNTLNSYIETAKLFYKWANENDIIKINNKIFNIKNKKNDAEPKHCPSKEDMQEVIQTIKNHTKNIRLFLMVKLCVYTGLRRQEVCNLKISDLTEDQIRVVGKGSKIRLQPVNKEVLEEMQEYIKTERQENIDKYIKMGGEDLGYVFISGINDIDNYKEKVKNLSNGNKICESSFYKQIKNICSKLNIENNNKISPHTLRHFFGTSIYESTNDLALTQEAMRHSDLSTTRRYVHINQKRIQEALSNFNI